MPAESPRRRRWWLLGYLLVLSASHLTVALSPGRPIDPGPRGLVVRVPTFVGDTPGDRRVEMVVEPWESVGSDAPWVVLLHGSPGSSAEFDGLAARLSTRRRVLAVDLPGFGRSRVDVPDYSFRAHGNQVLAAMDSLGIDTADVVGFSMGGGVALTMVDRAPERVRSLVLLSALGVQELELLGHHDANHLLHSVQYWALRILGATVPHFGAWGDGGLDLAYARNFLDSDQRPLRGILERLEAPLLILHGGSDPLVPVGAAREHHRIVPHSRLHVHPEGHFLLWQRVDWLHGHLADFLDDVDRGQAPRRTDAPAARVAAAQGPPDPEALRTRGFALVLLSILIVLGTFVSEDLTCISTGLLISLGRLDFALGLSLCVTGIYFGDLLLYAAGRVWGAKVVRRAPLSWVLSEARLREAEHWFERRGVLTVFLTRFVPGLRLPTYVAAGVLRARFPVFAGAFLVAVLVWTPLLVGLAAWAGGHSLELVEEFRTLSLWIGLGVALLLLVLLRLVPSLVTWSGRRRWVGRWRRLRHWEFWPPWVFYPPVVVHVLGLGVRYRSLGLVTAANPGIETGGFVGESKAAILALLGDDPRVARWTRIPASAAPAEREARAAAFQATLEAAFPVVLKPDVGERGRGVRILHDSSGLAEALTEIDEDHLLQEYVAGDEFGVFVVRDPGAPSFRILSLTRKRLPEVVGDGASSLRRLILADPRAVSLADTYLRAHVDDLDRIPAVGERVRLVELGTHCRGAVFLDGTGLITPALTAALDDLAGRAEGFHFGRFDLRAPDEAALRQGRDLKVLELNGVTSEATHIYDPRGGLRDAWRVLREQWSLAFGIAAHQRDQGAVPLSTVALLRRILER